MMMVLDSTGRVIERMQSRVVGVLRCRVWIVRTVVSCRDSGFGWKLKVVSMACQRGRFAFTF